MSIADFKGTHKGETMLFVGLGSNLRHTPLELFDYPSISVNSIHKRSDPIPADWTPDYYTCVDKRNWTEYGEEIAERFAHIPKFVPERLAKWKGDNFHIFKGEIVKDWLPSDKGMWQEDISRGVVTYLNITHVALKLLYHMGASTILIIGMEHMPHYSHVHYWGDDTPGISEDHVRMWFEGYKQIADGLAGHGVRLLNLSPATYVPESVIPRADWREWVRERQAVRA